MPLLGLLTWKLLQSRPVPEGLTRELASLWDWLPFLVAKSFHVGGFGLLAFLATVALPARLRLLAVALLVLHGAATELAQTRVPNRHGSAADAVIDAAGVALGALAGRRFRRAPPC